MDKTNNGQWQSISLYLLMVVALIVVAQLLSYEIVNRPEVIRCVPTLSRNTQ